MTSFANDLLMRERFVRFLTEGQRDISEGDARRRAEILELGKIGPLYLVVELSLHLEMLPADKIDAAICDVEYESQRKLKAEGWECLEYVSSRNSVILVVSANDAGEYASLPVLFANMIKALMMTIDIVIFAGIGSAVGALTDIKHSANDARLCIAYKYSAAQDNVINIKDVNKLVVRSADENSTAFERVIGCFLDGDFDRLKVRLDELLSGIDSGSIKKGLTLNLMYLELMAQILHRVTAIGILVDGDIESAYVQRILNERHPERLYSGFLEDCSRYMMLIKEKQKRSTVVIATLAKEYVERNYSDSTLSQQTVSERIGLSTAYFGQVFLSQTGFRFIDYLHEYRMEMAKKRLRTTNEKIRDISASVGFTNVNYFNTLFRKKTGMTPNNFRTVEHGDHKEPTIKVDDTCDSSREASVSIVKMPDSKNS